MNTPAHTLMAAALLARPDRRGRNAVVIYASLVPDAMIFSMVGWERFVNGHSFREIFDERYFAPEWDTFFAVPNSIPLYLAGMAAGLLLGVELLWVFCAAAFVHVIFDLPLHHDDGHEHFWPFTDWVFASPVSYWDPAHHGMAAGMAEAALCVVLGVILWRRFRGVFARALIGLGMAFEMVTALGWLWMLVLG
jgi:hypothetical protein